MISDAFKERLKLLVGDESIRSFAGRCGASEGTMRRYLRGETTPDLEMLHAIADAGGCTLAWLAAGQGPIKRGETVYPPAEALGGTENVSYPPVPFAELSELSQRFLRLPSLLDMDDEGFCRAIELDPVELDKIKAGRPVPGLLIRAVAYEWGIRTRWLKMGELPFKNPGGVDHFAREMWGYIEMEVARRRAEGEDV